MAMSNIFPYIDTWIPKFDDNPVSALTELAAIRKWRLEYTPVREIGPTHNCVYSIGVAVNGWKFRDVEDRKKKVAKKRACHLALTVIYMRSTCILQDKIPEDEVELASSLNLTPQDIVVVPGYTSTPAVSCPEEVPKTDSDETDFTSDNFPHLNPVYTTGTQPLTVPAKGPPPKKKVKVEVTEVNGRSPVMILNVFCQRNNLDVMFEAISVTGQGHDSEYTVRLVIGGKEYPPMTGHSKKAARHNAAVVTIQQMVDDGLQVVLDAENLTLIDRPPKPVPIKRKLPERPPKERIETDFVRNAVTILSEYAQSHYQKLRFESVYLEKGAPVRFEMSAVVGDRVFGKVECTTKRLGRLKAADHALKEILAGGEVIPSLHTGYLELEVRDGMSHADKIGALSHKAINKIFTELPPLPGHKVAAAIVMKLSEEDVGTVVCVGVGNKIHRGDAIDPKGQIVNDSHSPVIARRSFIRYLYKQLESCTSSVNGEVSTVSIKSEIFQESAAGRLAVRPGVTFHLYLSSMPCGDAAVFSATTALMEEVYAQDVDTPIYPTPSHGSLQTKSFSGSTIIAVSDKLDEMLASATTVEKLHTMSCSDKICRWNVLGLQGALLSHYLDPIYLSSITIGNHYHGGHLSRAVGQRCQLETNGLLALELPTCYHLNIPEIGKLTLCKPPRDVYKMRQYSVNWVLGDDLAEVTNAVNGNISATGDDSPEVPSQLCKAEFFKKFKDLCSKTHRGDLLVPETYYGCKMAAKDYQIAKEVLKKRLADNNFGKWMNKPDGEDMFT